MLRDEMTITELSAMGIELHTSTFDDRMYFDTVVSGDQIEDFATYELFQFAICTGLRHEVEFLDNLACAEILSPYYTISRYLNPAMMHVQVYGYSLPDNKTVYVQWKWADIKRDISDFWNFILRGIQSVQTVEDVSDQAESLLSCVHIKSMMENYAGIWLMLDDKFSTLNIQSMTRAVDCLRLDNGETLLCFRGRYASVMLQSGEIITFVVQKSGEGIEQEIKLYKGIYHHCKYYQERVICDEKGS